MADIKVNYEELESLFDKGEYSQVLEKCTVLLEELDKPEQKLRFMSLKALLLTCEPEQIAKDLDKQTDLEKDIFRILGSIGSSCDDFKDILKLETDFENAIVLWEKNTIEQRLNKLVENPTYDGYMSYVHMMPIFSKMSIFTQVTLNKLEPVVKAAESNGMKLGEFASKHKPKRNPSITKEERSRLEYEAVQKMFEYAKEFLASEGDASSNYVSSKVGEILNKFLVCEQLAGYSVPDENPLLTGRFLENLKLQAKILDYELKAKIYPNGKEMYLSQGDGRNNTIDRLQSIYDRIIKKQPNFVAPILPSKATATQRTTVTRNTTPQSSGGCYVATCVYGSYDCPQVWTLRRYRDNMLANSFYGRAFIKIYYAVSPTLVKWFGNTSWFKAIFKGRLDRMVDGLRQKGVEDTPYSDKQW